MNLCEARPGLIARFWICALVAVWLPLASAYSLSQQNEAGESLAATPDARLGAIEHQISASEFPAAAMGLAAYLEEHPDSSKAHYDLGYVKFRTHQIGPSIKELSKSLELNPKSAEAHEVLALDCSIIGRSDLTEVELLEAARLKPSSAEIHYFLARTYYTRGVYPLAKSEFETAIRLDSSYIKAYSNLGITMEALGKTDSALSNYRTAIQLEEKRKQKSEWPFIYLSAFYNRQKNPTEALIYAREAIEIKASDAAYFEMAKAYRALKQLHKAVDATRSAIAINSGVPDYYYVMGLMLRELGNQQESKQALEQYAQLQAHSDEDLLENKAQEPLVSSESQSIR